MSKGSHNGRCLVVTVITLTANLIFSVRKGIKELSASCGSANQLSYIILYSSYTFWSMSVSAHILWNIMPKPLPLSEVSVWQAKWQNTQTQSTDLISNLSLNDGMTAALSCISSRTNSEPLFTCLVYSQSAQYCTLQSWNHYNKLTLDAGGKKVQVFFFFHQADISIKWPYGKAQQEIDLQSAQDVFKCLTTVLIRWRHLSVVWMFRKWCLHSDSN